MHKTRFLLGALLCLPFVAHAASFASIESARCTGTLSSSLAAEASYLCTGDLFLVGGSITSGAAVVLHADGALFLDRLSITAPTIDLWSFGGTVTVGSGASLRFAGGAPVAIARPVVVPPRVTLPTGSDTLQVFPGGDVSLVGGGRVSLVDGGPTRGPIAGPTPGGGVVQIIAGGGIVLSGRAGSTGSLVGLAGGDLLLSGNGGVVTLASPVPEPSAALMMCVGLLALLGAAASRKRRG